MCTCKFTYTKTPPEIAHVCAAGSLVSFQPSCGGLVKWCRRCAWRQPCQGPQNSICVDRLFRRGLNIPTVTLLLADNSTCNTSFPCSKSKPTSGIHPPLQHSTGRASKHDKNMLSRRPPRSCDDGGLNVCSTTCSDLKSKVDVKVNSAVPGFIPGSFQ